MQRSRCIAPLVFVINDVIFNNPGRLSGVTRSYWDMPNSHLVSCPMNSVSSNSCSTIVINVDIIVYRLIRPTSSRSSRIVSSPVLSKVVIVTACMQHRVIRSKKLKRMLHVCQALRTMHGVVN